MNNLPAVFEKNLPLRAYVEQDLNKHLIMDFMPWLCKLLSLTDEVSANRLEMALPAIRTQCISMGFSEIKKMFELYADSKLDVLPKSNYFDRVLLGQIVKSYIKHKNTLNIKKVDPNSEKEERDYVFTTMLFDDFKQSNNIHENFYWVYTYLESKEILKVDEKLKRRKYNIFLDKNGGDKEKAIIQSKISLLEDFFNRLIHKEGKHIKDYL